MTYSALIESSKEKVYNHAIATKILDLMDKLRMSDNAHSKRRWVWELMQNAKDARYPETSVKVSIAFDELFGILNFSHNGQPFNIDNITFLIEQVSTKERNKKEESDAVATTGKFGTGFLTTHLLSEKVMIKSFVKELGLPFKSFELELDRSGTSIDNITASIQNSLNILSAIENNGADEAYDPSAFNTQFSYQLNAEGENVARAGLTDLDNMLPFTMAFLPEIESVHLTDYNIIYKRKLPLKKFADNIYIHTLFKEESGKDNLIVIAALKYQNITIAIPVKEGSDGYEILQMDNTLPKLFCDFPLIGTEDFSIPFVINCPDFNPNEPRNGVFLTDRNDKRIDENKEIFDHAINLFGSFLELIAGAEWKGVHELARIKQPPEKDWFSKTWFEKNVLDKTYMLLGHCNIVKNEIGENKSILTEANKPAIWFPAGSATTLREKIWHLCYQWIPEVIPAKATIHNWYSVLWAQCGRLNVENLTQWINNWKNIASFPANFTDDKTKILWLNQYYDILNVEGKTILEVIAGKYEVIPNQNGEFKRVNDLLFDSGLDENLKDILLFLGDDIRDKLRNKFVITSNKADSNVENQIRHHLKKPDDVIARINKLLIQHNEENQLEAALRLISLFSQESSNNFYRHDVYKFASTIFDDQLPAKSIITNNDDAVWTKADEIIIHQIIQMIAKNGNLRAFTNRFQFTSSTTALSWLHELIIFLEKNEYAHFLNIDNLPILPNQHGDFISKDDVFLDGGTTDDLLKDICQKLGYDIKKDLLDKSIFLELSESRTIDIQIAADQITTRVLPRFSELPRTEETREIFRMIYRWFKNNRESAEKRFQELYAGKHKLYDDEEVAENMHKAEELKQLMDEFSISNMSELRDLIMSNVNTVNLAESTQITGDSLVSLGIGSLEELTEALKDVNFAEKFSHASIPTLEMFVYAHELIE